CIVGVRHDAVGPVRLVDDLRGQHLLTQSPACDAGRVVIDGGRPSMPTDRPRIALLAAPETSPSVQYGLYDVLLSTGAVYPDMTTAEPGDALLDVAIRADTRQS